MGYMMRGLRLLCLQAILGSSKSERSERFCQVEFLDGRVLRENPEKQLGLQRHGHAIALVSWGCSHDVCWNIPSFVKVINGESKQEW
jgi:hypothetical protein